MIRKELSLLDLGGVPVEGEDIEFEIWESPKHWNSNRCNRDNRFRCDIGTTPTDEFGNFVFSTISITILC